MGRKWYFSKWNRSNHELLDGDTVLKAPYDIVPVGLGRGWKCTRSKNCKSKVLKIVSQKGVACCGYHWDRRPSCAQCEIEYIEGVKQMRTPLPKVAFTHNRKNGLSYELPLCVKHGGLPYKKKYDMSCMKCGAYARRYKLCIACAKYFPLTCDICLQESKGCKYQCKAKDVVDLEALSHDKCNQFNNISFSFKSLLVCPECRKLEYFSKCSVTNCNLKRIRLGVKFCEKHWNLKICPTCKKKKKITNSKQCRSCNQDMKRRCIYCHERKRVRKKKACYKCIKLR